MIQEFKRGYNWSRVTNEVKLQEGNGTCAGPQKMAKF